MGNWEVEQDDTLAIKETVSEVSSFKKSYINDKDK